MNELLLVVTIAEGDITHSPSPAHARHRCVVVLHTGVVPPHCAFDVHGTHVALDTSQAGVAPVHLVALVAEQIPQAPLDWQAGVAPPHSLSPLQARQTRNAGSQTGVEPPQSAFARQPTHDFVEVLQTGVAPEHWLLFRHCTQVAVEVSQMGVEPPHRPMLVAEQAPEAPLDWQAGALAGQSASAAQLRQACVLPSQTGVVPEQLLAVRHATQVLGEALVRQYGVDPEQSLFARHWSTNTLAVVEG